MSLRARVTAIGCGWRIGISTVCLPATLSLLLRGFVSQFLSPLFFLFLLLGQISLALLILVVGFGQVTSFDRRKGRMECSNKHGGKRNHPLVYPHYNKPCPSVGTCLGFLMHPDT